MPETTGLSAAEFAARVVPLGPLGPLIAVAVSGGADSMALALLTRDFVAANGLAMRALIVDHGLRSESAAEAALAARRLAAIGVDAQVLCLEGLSRGAGLAERARAARYECLTRACRAAGIVHLLLGHHAGDQAETVLMRAGAGSGPAGLAGMAAWRATGEICLLRPLLDVPPGRLRATLRAAALDWSEDPSNTDHRALRARLRAALADPDGDGPAIAGLLAQAREQAEGRAAAARRVAGILAERVCFYPEGFALLADAPIDPAGLAAVLQAVSGAAYPASPRQVARLAVAPVPATLGGARLLPAGRLGAGRLLVVREAAAMAAPCPACVGTPWDGRFRLTSAPPDTDGLTLGALGNQAREMRRWSPLPDAILRSLPAIRREGDLVAVPHLLYPDRLARRAWHVVFSPAQPAAGAHWISA